MAYDFDKITYRPIDLLFGAKRAATGGMDDAAML